MHGIWNNSTNRWVEGSDRKPLGFELPWRARGHAAAIAPVSGPNPYEARPLPEGMQISKESPLHG